MKKRSSKKNHSFSRDREFTVILEDLRSQFRVFGEGMQLMLQRMDRLEVRMDSLEQRVDKIENFLLRVMPTVATKDDLRALEKRVEKIEATMATKADLERFATKEDLRALEERSEKRFDHFEKRFDRLEATVATKNDLHALEKRIVDLETSRN